MKTSKYLKHSFWCYWCFNKRFFNWKLCCFQDESPWHPLPYYEMLLCNIVIKHGKLKNKISVKTKLNDQQQFNPSWYDNMPVKYMVEKMRKQV